MKSNNYDKDKVIHLVIRVPKEEAAFTYFTFEANEGLCFYSTLDESLKTGHRDIDIKTHESLKTELFRMIQTLSEKFPIDIIKNSEEN